MKKLDPVLNTREKVKIDKNYDKASLRIGFFYSKFNTHQKKRFDRLVYTIAHKYGFALNRHPAEMILIRQIALNTIRIDEKEAFLMDNDDSKIEKSVRDIEESRRKALESLATWVKLHQGQESVVRGDEIMNFLREEKGLPKVKSDPIKDGHDRRYYDKVTRTKK